jgi:3-oxoadipate enol-lactonase
MVDPSGHGKSEKLTATFDFADCARCIVDILDALGENRTHFVGKPTTFATRPDVVAFVHDTVTAVDIGSASWAVKSVVPGRPDQRSLFANIATPVLVVPGAEDATFPLSETITMAEAIPGAAVAVLDGIAHLAGLENPPLVNALIEEFVFRE